MLSIGALVLLATVSASEVPIPGSGRIERLADFPSRLVTPRNIDIWLPDAYPAAAPYDVLYMLDGQMLFDARHTWNRQEWRADEVAGALVSKGSVRPFIIVGVWNPGAARHAEYSPQRPFEALDGRERADVYALGRDLGRPQFPVEVYSDRFLRFLTAELKPHVDAHFAVDGSREHTHIAGSSMGGLIALYAISEHPDVFGGAACLSTHWFSLLPGPGSPMPPRILAYLRKHLPDPRTHRLYFDHGTETLDADYGEWQVKVDTLMRKRGYGAANWQTRVFDGADHSEQAWSARLRIPLEFLMGRSR